MTTQSFDWIAQSPVGVFMAENELAFPWIESIHVLAVATVLGMLLVIDLRLIGWASTSYRVSRLTRALLPVTWGGFVLAAITGGLLFCSNPNTYFGNTAFRVKMLLLLVAGVNMLIFHVITGKTIHLWDDKPQGPTMVRAAGAFSMLLWVGVVICGRWIGFTMDPF